MKRILLADDEETFLYATADLLRLAGHECDCVQDGASAIAKLHEQAYALIISDIKMPGNSNLELIQLLPQLAAGVPVILVTGYPTLRSAVQSIQLPVVAYLTKPLDFDELLRQTRAALAQGQPDHTLRLIRQQMQAWSENLQALERSVFQRRGGALAAEATVIPPQYGGGGRTWGETNMTPEQLRTLREIRGLSAREWEIARRLWSHETVNAIAKSLFVSKHTVRNHLKAIFRKVGVHSQAALLKWLAQHAGEPNAEEKP